MESNELLQSVLDEFLHISAIPRPSHHEEKIASYLCSWAQTKGLACVRDELGDVIIDKPASPGCEGAPKVILQAHMDMVCVAAQGVEYRPLEDPIRVKNDGTTLSAEGTSLGADDGIGIALALHLLADNTLTHGPLRALFTVNEEDGMSSGAIDPKYLDGDYLINLDWEWLGSLCNSSAGGDFMAFTRTYSPCPVSPDSAFVQLELSGLLGGHSGVDIHRGRANALAELAKLLLGLPEQGIAYQLADFHGGQARNAIPAAAQAVIAVQPEDMPRLQTVLEASAADLKASYNQVDPGLELRWKSLPASMSTIPVPDASALLGLMLTLPNGVHTMSPFAEGLVESSQNVGLLEHEPCTLRLSAMARSCDLSRAEELLTIDRLLSGAFGFSFEQGEHSPAWAVNPKSRLTPLACQVYRELTGSEMVVEPVHGALECGAFFEKNPHLDMIAIGPSLRDVHTPKETCDLESVHITAALLIELLRRLAH